MNAWRLQSNVELQKEDLLQLSSDILDRGSCVRFIARGYSMHPFIKDGEVIIVKPVKIFEIMRGDVIFYHASQEMVAHRVIKKCRENDKIVLVTKGDSNFNFDSPFGEKNVMGKVIAIEKPNGTIMLDCKTWRIVNYMIARHSLLSLLIYRRICFLKRVVIGNRENRFVYIGSKVLSISLSLFPELLINFLFTLQRIISKLKPNTV